MTATQPRPLDDEDDDFGVFETADPVRDAELDAEADADIAAGRLISHEAVVRWLMSWGSANELPPPQCGE